MTTFGSLWQFGLQRRQFDVFQLDRKAVADGSGSDESTVVDGRLATDPHPVSTVPTTTAATSHRRAIRLEPAVQIGFAGRSAIMATS